VYQLKDKEPGLVDVIMENARLDNVIRIRKTPYENLFILPSGKVKEESHELLMSHRLKEICNKLRESNFDYVIFDTASLEFHEAGNLASHCDAALYVVSGKMTKQEAVKPKANIIGVIINNK
jgi:septum formation inhibitor-activating ATPase MinD